MTFTMTFYIFLHCTADTLPLFAVLPMTVKRFRINYDYCSSYNILPHHVVTWTTTCISI